MWTTKNQRTRRQHGARQPKSLFLESLEERCLLAAITWDGGGGSTAWANPLNWNLDRLPAAADDVSIPNLGSTNVVYSNAVAGSLSFHSVTVRGGASLTMPGASILTAETVTVEVGARISADGQGFAGGSYSPGAGPGGGGASGSAAGGGGHGGAGGYGVHWSGDYAPGGGVYGSATQPTTFGSGGGATTGSGSYGGSGGGALRLVVGGTLTLDGQITANGSDGGGFGGGGGAGGSIWVTAGTLTGTGVFRANGGSGYFYGGGGGGGRVAVEYTQGAAFTGYAASSAWGGGSPSSAGGAYGTVGFVNQSVAGGNLHVYTQFGTLRDGSLSFGAVTVHTGATIVMPGSTTLTADNVTVQSGGKISADGLGIAGGSYAAGGGTGGGGASGNAAGGGGHGGAGGYGSHWGGSFAAGGAVYGDPIAPTTQGSGGGGVVGGVGGTGGGALRIIISGALQLDGEISARGAAGYGGYLGNAGGGGGAGGSIWVTTGNLSGSGSFKADGGAAGAYAGGGGGGRIAVEYSQTSTFTGYATSTAAGGAGGLNGSPAGGTGTVGFIDQTVSGGHLHVYTQFAPLRDGSLNFGAVTVHTGAMIVMPGSTTLTADNITVQSGGRISADASGYAGGGYGTGAGPGGGGAASAAAGGGGHGGAGGYGFHWGGAFAPGGTAYGDPAAPTTQGSAGGAKLEGGSAGGSGGGALRIVVSGTLQNDGQITAHGGNGYGGYLGNGAGGGGAGGSIWLTSSNLQGNGVICANGGSGYFYAGGGGGGRIAIYYVTNTFAGQICVSGGGSPSSGAGGTGSIYTAILNRPPVADAGGPYTVAEGGSAVLDGSLSSDPDQPASSLTHEWDLDGDNVFGETGAAAARGNETGTMPTFSAAGLDGPSDVVVSLRVTDNGALSSIDTATIHVTNVAPGFDAGPNETLPVGSGAFSRTAISFTDPGTPDTWTGTVNYGDSATNFPLSIHPGDMAFDLAHTYTTNGTFTVTVTLADDDTGTHTDTFDVMVALNTPPTADAGGPYSAIVLGSVELDASDSSDAEDPNSAMTFEWDLDGDGMFGESGAAALRGDELGITPTFVTAGLPAGSSVTVSLRVTDSGGLPDEDTATIHVVNAPDLTIRPGSIRFTPVNSAPGQPVVIQADVQNVGLASAANVAVSLADFGLPIGSQTIASLAPSQTVTVTFDPVSFPESLRLIVVTADPASAIAESNEANNDSSALLQVGAPDISVGGVFLEAEIEPLSACAGQPATVRGDSWYDFLAVPGEQDFAVQGGQVTVTVRDLATSQIVSVFSGSHTDVSGHIGQGIIAPGATGTYLLHVEVTDLTLDGEGEGLMTVGTCPAPPLPTFPPSGGVPPDGGGGVSPGNGTPGPIDDGSPQPGDVWVFSEDILFSAQPQQIGDSIFVIAFIHYSGAAAVEDVAVTINDIFPISGALHSFPIASTTVDFPASAGAATYVTLAVPWTPMADGPHIIQVSTDPDWTQFEGNDEATRLIGVGAVPDFLTLDKSVTLAIDADGNFIASPGDTLEYTVTYTNTVADDLTGAVLIDDFADRYVTLVSSPTVDGGVIDGGAIAWNVGTIAAGASESLTYRALVNSAANFPGGLTRVVNTALLDTNETIPVAARARISVLGDAIPPVTTAMLDTAANAAGWHNTDVTVNLTAVDNAFGSGMRRVIYTIDGEPAVSTLGSAASFTITAEGQHTIVFQAVDVAGNYEAPQTIHVNIDKTAPIAVHSGPFVVLEGSSVVLDGTQSFDDLSGVEGTAWSLDGDGQFDDGDPASVAGLDGPSTHTVFLRVIDLAGNFAIAQTDVQVLNVAPAVNIDLSASSIDENDAVTATGSFTDPGTLDTHTVVIDWGPGEGSTTISNADLSDCGDGDSTTKCFSASHQYRDDNPTGTAADKYTITATVTDDDSGTGSGSDVLTVNNLAPVIASFNGPTLAVPGQPLSYSASFNDVGSLDMHTTSWQVTNSNNVVVASGAGLSFNFTPSTPDSYTVTFKVMDDDTGAAIQSQALAVSFANTQTGVCCATTGAALVVGSLTVNDRIHVNPIGNDGTLQVTITSRTYDVVVYQQSFAAPAGGFSQIVIFGQAADDYIQIADSIAVPACIHAGAGNDNVKGGGGHDILIGGDGDDMLIGGGGRDLLIGGYGSDRMVGNTDDDILVAGYTVYDNNDEALCAIMREWTSVGTYSARVANLTSGGGLNGAYRLSGADGAAQTAFNDNNADTLTGSQGVDWFLANQVADNGGTLDKVTDQAANELWSDTDF